MDRKVQLSEIGLGLANSIEYGMSEVIGAGGSVGVTLHFVMLCGASGENRTPTSVKIRDFESRASTSSATEAHQEKVI